MNEPNLLPRPRSLRLVGATAPARPPAVELDPRLPPQGYRLTVDPGGVRIVGADEAGAFYGRATLDQLTRTYGDTLPALEIEDAPDLPVRGVMLDVSRDKVPTTGTLKDLVRRLASWKVNQVQLYMEHTFAYARHRSVWADADPLTPDEVRDLDAFCRERHVELVPNQNCLGHMERWLRHEPYRALAIAPDGWTDARGRRREPTTLDPAKPGSLELVRELLSELLPNFSARRVHVGLDEPWELPAERTGEYLGWLESLRALPELDSYEMLVWGDILANHPDMLGRIPDGVTVCDWWYEASHPFDARCAALAGAGLPFWTCPGTSAWNSLVGRGSNARANLAGAAEAALAHGGRGYLITDWGDNGHLQYLPVSEPWFAYGAAVSWCLDANRDIDLAPALSTHWLCDPTGELAAALLELADVHRQVVPQIPNMSILVMHLYWPQLRVGEGFTEGLTTEDLSRVEEAIDAAVARLGRARPGRPDGELVLDEVRNAASLLALLCRDARARLGAGGDGTLRGVPAGARRELGESLGPIIDRHRTLWLARNRRGGLRDSLARLERLARVYETGEAR